MLKRTAEHRRHHASARFMARTSNLDIQPELPLAVRGAAEISSLNSFFKSRTTKGNKEDDPRLTGADDIRLHRLQTGFLTWGALDLWSLEGYCL